MNRAAATVPAPAEATVIDLAEQLASLLTRARLPDLAAAATLEAAHLRRAVPTVAVLGELKRGKSSLINAVIGRDLLPVGALPLTSVGTRLVYGDAVRVTVERLDGDCEAIAPAAIADYATERGNPGNRRGVASVTISCPAAVLRGRLDLIDTPGIGSAFADVTGTARAWMARADIALVVLSAEQPASRRELDLLRQVIAAGPYTLVVENKIDLVPAAERGQVMEFVRAQVGRLGADAAPPVFAVSSAAAQGATASGVPALEAALIELAQRAGGAIVTRGARSRLAQIAERALAARRLRARAAPLAELWHEQRQARLQQQLGVVLLRDLLDAQARAATAADAIARSLGAGLTDAAVERRLQALAAVVPPAAGARSVRRWAANLEARLRDELAALLNRWRDGEYERLQPAADAVAAAWRADLADAIASIRRERLALPIPRVDIQSPAVEIPEAGLARRLLLPGAIGRRQVRRRARRWMRATVSTLVAARRAAVRRNLTQALRRSADDWRQQVAASFESRRAHAAPPRGEDPDSTDAELQRLRDRLRERTDGR